MIAFRVDGGLDIGVAHIVRCLNIAKSLNKKQEVAFLLKHYDDNILELLNGFNVVILKTFFDFVQHYQPEKVIFDVSHKHTLNNLEDLKKDIKLLSSNSIETIMFDGATLNDAIHRNIDTSVDFLIVPYPNINKSNYKVSEKTVFLTGLKHFVFNDVIFQKYPKKGGAKDRILISLGGSDVNRLSIKVLDLLRNYNVRKDVIVNNSFDEKYKVQLISFCEQDDMVEVIEQISIEEMYKAIQASDLLITSIGLTKYEASFLRTPSLIISSDDEMKSFHLDLERLGIYYLGRLKDSNKLTSSIQEVMSTEHDFHFPEMNSICDLIEYSKLNA
jgi:spore coat polysaccharide biosynthesis predicted glycosyltransferase SpsG